MGFEKIGALVQREGAVDMDRRKNSRELVREKR
jgi:hypothetical protein